MGELAVHAVLAVPQVVVDAWVVHTVDMALIALGLVLAPRQGEVLTGAEGGESVQLLVKQTLLREHSTKYYYRARHI